MKNKPPNPVVRPNIWINGAPRIWDQDFSLGLIRIRSQPRIAGQARPDKYWSYSRSMSPLCCSNYLSRQKARGRLKRQAWLRFRRFSAHLLRDTLSAQIVNLTPPIYRCFMRIIRITTVRGHYLLACHECDLRPWFLTPGIVEGRCPRYKRYLGCWLLKYLRNMEVSAEQRSDEVHVL